MHGLLKFLGASSELLSLIWLFFGKSSMVNNKSLNMCFILLVLSVTESLLWLLAQTTLRRLINELKNVSSTNLNIQLCDLAIVL